MNTAGDRTMEQLTALAWDCGTRRGRAEQARVIGELASALRRWARDALNGCRPATVESN